MSKKSQSFEFLLGQLANEVEPRDRAKRKRLEILAALLWRKGCEKRQADLQEQRAGAVRRQKLAELYCANRIAQQAFN
jgi:hypothetical protein